MIGDGDSSTYASIVKNVPVWGAHVEKLECANHALKCLRTNLEKLVTEKTHYKGKGGLTKSAIRKITLGVRCAIIMRTKESDKLKAVKKLKADIRNAGHHVLGYHDNCSTDFCKHKKETNKQCDNELDNTEDVHDEDIIADQCEYWQDATHDLSKQEISALRHGGLYSSTPQAKHQLLKDIFFLLNRLSEKSHRLLGNFTSNLAESWMNVRCKFDGGKMFNKCFKGSFYARCYGGALRTMLGPAWSPQLYSKISGKRPDDVYLETYRMRAASYKHSRKASKKRENILKKKERKMKSSLENTTKKAKQHYGDSVLIDTPDISTDELKMECDQYLANNISNSKKSDIEMATRGQANNENWHNERKKTDHKLSRIHPLPDCAEW